MNKTAILSTKRKDIKYLIALDKAFVGIGKRRTAEIISSGLSFEDAWLKHSKLSSQKNLSFLEKLNEESAKIDPDEEMARLERLKISFTTVFDEDYPAMLKEIFSPPTILYYGGALDVLSENILAIVGSRKFTNYGKEATKKIVAELAEAGIVIASGMALGIDTIAHETALKSGGKTVAVLGCGLNTPYPATNANLFKKIIEEGGLAVSEYPPGVPPLRQNFPARNRIIAGVSLGSIIIEANQRSGALITARDALEQNRDVFAVPGPIFHQSSSGTNQLLKMGANLITSGQDILDFYGHKAKPKEATTRPGNETEEIIFKVLEGEEKHIDDIIKESRKESQLIISTLTLMEIKGKVKNLGGMVYALE